jgi:hypothetical protein
MPVLAWILIALAVLAVVAGAIWAVMRQRRSTMLRERFGPEYQRAVTERGGRRKGESELAARQRRRDKLDIRPLAPESRERHAASWRETQTRFVDDPSGAVRDADRLVILVMQECGYPMDDFEQRSADISVDHPQVVNDYRAAHAISLANDHDQASTEDLRQAMVHYRTLFEQLLQAGQDERTTRAG